MVDSLQQTCGFAGLATHLFWSEPSNYAFVTLLRKRVFHTICENAPGFQQNPAAYGNVAKEVLRVMSHLFERVSLTQSAAQDAAITDSPSRSVTFHVQLRVNSYIMFDSCNISGPYCMSVHGLLHRMTCCVKVWHLALCHAILCLLVYCTSSSLAFHYIMSHC